MEEKELEQTADQAKPKGLLYHYTTIDGLIGILDSDCLRATHIRYMNDAQEFLDALEHLDAFTNEFDESLRPRIKDFVIGSVPTFVGRHGAYVASFTDDEAQLTESGTPPGDRLSQWRAYSGAGKGFSMGFDYNAVDKSGCGMSWGIQGSVAYFLACAYTPAEKRGFFGRVGQPLAGQSKKDIEELAYALSPAGAELLMRPKEENNPPAGSDDVVASVRKRRFDMMLAYLINATLFKNPAFAEEKEWRIVVVPFGTSLQVKKTGDCAGIQVKFRSGVVGITPYIDLPLLLNTPESPLRRIVVGPTPHMEEAVRGVEMKLMDRGIRRKCRDYPNGVEVVPSRIPYRNW
jgi:hypothetical protein